MLKIEQPINVVVHIRTFILLEVLHRFIFTTSINKRDKSFTILTIFHMIVSEVVTGRGYAFVVFIWVSFDQNT